MTTPTTTAPASPATAVQAGPLVPVTVYTTRDLADPANRPVTVTGWLICPGLAVTPALRRADGRDTADSGQVFSGTWAVVHVPTGLRVPAGSIEGATVACLHHAEQFARRLAATGIDWTADRETLAADPTVRHACRDCGREFAFCTHPTDCADWDTDGD